MSATRESLADTLNRECHCSLTDTSGLGERIDGLLRAPQSIRDSHPNLFSAAPVFLSGSHAAQLRELVAAVHGVVRLPTYQQAVLTGAPAIARVDAAHHGVFQGFDFHIGADGPKLIEINTNAGGAFLNRLAWEAQRACCDTVSDYLARLPTGQDLEDEIIAMFRREWLLARGGAPLRSIAIVDENPTGQFLYPEFRLAQRLFERHGIRTHVADVHSLTLKGGGVRIGGESIDLIYNRHTDFYFDTPALQVMRTAYERNLAVITPHPRAHAFYARKQNLALLGDSASLDRIGAAPSSIEILARQIPATRAVQGCQESWWQDRRKWFFKPQSGFGGRGAYRGDKLTRRVMGEIMNGDYVAQQFIPAGERHHAESTAPLKVDIRCYAYEGQIQLMAARLYQGQTTNFRTAGGGFAPVYIVDEDECRK